MLKLSVLFVILRRVNNSVKSTRLECLLTLQCPSWLVLWRFWFRLVARQEFFSLQNVKTDSGIHLTSCSMVIWGSSLRTKWTGREVGDSVRLVPRLIMRRARPPLVLCALMACARATSSFVVIPSYMYVQCVVIYDMFAVFSIHRPCIVCGLCCAVSCQLPRLPTRKNARKKKRKKKKILGQNNLEFPLP